MKLTAAAVKTHVKNPPDTGAKTYGDGRGGHGLTLCVTAAGNAYWYQRLQVDGRPRNIGLGPCSLVTLSEARDAALKNHQAAYRGEPVATKREAMPTVRGVLAECAQARNASETWTRPVLIHASDILDRRVNTITTADAMAVLKPVWNTKRDTAKKVKQRLSAAMRWAVAQGHRTDDPFGQVIDAALPKNGYRQTHHKALPHDQVADALRNVRASDRVWIGTRLAFEFLVLTACRSGEVRGARWSEMDLSRATWTIPGDRMKMGRPHRVPLSSACLRVLSAAKALGTKRTDLVFPSRQRKTLSDSTVSKLLRERGVEAVPHGFRSSFRDWCSESGVSREVSEFALAHVEGNAVVAAYLRSDLLEQRRQVMESWGHYVTGTNQ